MKKTTTSPQATNANARKSSLSQKTLNEATSGMDRAAITKLIKAAHKQNTDREKYAQLFEIAVTDPNLDNAAAFTTVFCVIGMAMKFSEMSGTQRQAAALDPRVVRAIVPHVALAFPKQTDKMVTLWLKSIVEDHPKLWQSIYDRACDVGPKQKRQRRRRKAVKR